MVTLERDFLSQPLLDQTTKIIGLKKKGFARIFDFNIEFKEDPFQLKGTKFKETRLVQDILFLLSKLGLYEQELKIGNETENKTFIPTPDAELEFEEIERPTRKRAVPRTGPRVTKKIPLRVPKIREKGGRPQESALSFSFPNITRSFNTNSLKNQIFSDPFKFINISPFLIEEINKNRI